MFLEGIFNFLTAEIETLTWLILPILFLLMVILFFTSPLQEYKLGLSTIAISGSFMGYFSSLSRITAMPDIISMLLSLVLSVFFYKLFILKELRKENTQSISWCIILFCISLFHGSRVGAETREDAKKEKPQLTCTQEKS